MAEWRAIHRKITTSWDVAQLNRLGKILFTWGIVCADNYGILEDDLGAIKLEILAGEDCTLEEIEKELRIMEERGLVWRYDGGKPLLQFQCFDDYQPKELLRKRGKSKWPVHPDWQPPEDVEVRHIPDKADIGQTRPDKAARKKDIERKKRKSSKRESRLDHPAIIGYKQLARLHVPIALRDDWIECAEEVGTEHLLAIVKAWIGRGYKPGNVKGMMEVARKGWADAKGRRGRSTPTIDYDKELKRQAEEKLDA